MNWPTFFVYDREHDVITSWNENVVLKTKEDVGSWATYTIAQLAKYNKQVDLLVDLRGLRVRPGVSFAFGKWRSKILEKHVRFLLRYGADPMTAMVIETNGVVQRVHEKIYSNREAALEALLNLRSTRSNQASGPLELRSEP